MSSQSPRRESFLSANEIPLENLSPRRDGSTRRRPSSSRPHNRASEQGILGMAQDAEEPALNEWLVGESDEESNEKPEQEHPSQRPSFNRQSTTRSRLRTPVGESRHHSPSPTRMSPARPERLLARLSSECECPPDHEEISNSMRGGPFSPVLPPGSPVSSRRSHELRASSPRNPSPRTSTADDQVHHHHGHGPTMPEQLVYSSYDRGSHLPEDCVIDPELVDDDSTLAPEDTICEEDEKDIMTGRTLFMFTAKSPIRCFLHNTLVSLPWNHINSVLTLVQLVFLSLETSDNFREGPRGVLQPVKKIWTSWAFLALYCIYTFVAICKLVAFGAFTSRVMTPEVSKDMLLYFLSYLGSSVWLCRKRPYPVDVDHQSTQRCFFRKSWNRVEFISLVCFWVWFLVSVGKADQPGSLLVLISGVAHMRLLQLLDAVPITRIVLQALKAGAPLVGNVFIFILFFWLVYSITGLSSFNSSLRRQCIWVDPNGQEANYSSGQFCGSWYHPETQEKLPFVYSDDGSMSIRAKGYTCPVNSVCVSDENPYQNTVSFDNIFNSMEMVFVIMSQNTYSDIMYDIIAAEYPVSSLLFITGVVVMSYWLLSLLVAVMGTSFRLVRESMSLSPLKKKSSSSEHLWIFKRSLAGKIYLVLLPVAYILIILDVGFQAAWSGVFSHSSKIDFLYNWECGVSVYLFLEAAACFLLYLPHWKIYFSSFSNCTDLFLAFVNLGILGLKDHKTIYSYLTFFQLFRFYRVVAAFKVARDLWTLVLGNYRTLVSLTVFFFVLVFIASLIAAKMLRGSLPFFDDDGLVAPASFFDLANSFFAMYQIASTENWTQVMYFATENASSDFTAACIAAFLCGWLAFANFVVLNMFVAVMTDNVTSSVTNHRKEQVKFFAKKYLKDVTTQTEFSVSLTGLRSGLGKLMGSWSKDRSEESKEKMVFEEELRQRIITDFLASAEKDFEPEPLQRQDTFFDYFSASPIVRAAYTVRRYIARLFQRYPSSYTRTEMNIGRVSTSEGPTDGLTETDTAERSAPDGYVEYLYQTHARTETAIDSMRQVDPSFDRSLFIFGIDNPIRQFCQRLFPSSHGRRASGIEPRRKVWYAVSIFFMLTTVSMVVASCINTPIYHSNYTRLHGGGTMTWTWLTYLDVVFMVSFFSEFFIKVIADGFHYTPNAYTHNAWNMIDFVVLLSMLCTLINDFLHGPVSRYSRGLMALRALRLITVNPRSEGVFRAVFFSGLSQILVAGFMALSIMVPFAVWGKNIFNNRLRSCNDSDLEFFSDCVGEYASSPYNWDVWAPRTVQESYFDFDTFGHAMLITFGVLTLEGWTDVMHAVMAITGTDTNPIPFSRRYNALFPLFYNFIGTVLVMTMIIAIIIRNYTFSQGTAFLTEDQLTWEDLRKTFKMLRPRLPIPQRAVNTVRRFLLDQALNPVSIINIVETWSLGALTLFMITEHYPQSWGSEYWYVFGTSVSCLLIAACAGLKAWGQGSTLFRHDYWEIFALVVTPILAGLTLSLLSLQIQTLIIYDFQKAFVILVMGLWIPRIKLLRQLMRIATLNIADILTLIQTWFILYLTWAIAFNQIFGLTRIGPNSSSNQNFRSVPKALILLFRMSTGEGWNQIMDDYLVSWPNCVQQNNFFETDCGDHTMAYILFISWNVISMYIFANLFISLIYDTFWYIFRRRETHITVDDVDKFQRAWQIYDPEGTGFIPADDLYNLLRASTGYFDLYIYSKDPDYSVREILARSGAQVYSNPYKVDVEAIERYLEDMPVAKFRQRRELYDMFCAHMQYLQRPGKGLSFHRSLKLFPLYKDMDPSKVLTLKQFLKLKLVLHQLKLELAADLIVRRWKLYRAREMGGIITPASSRPSTPPVIIPDIIVEDSPF